MRTIVYILTLGLVLLFFFCKQKPNKNGLSANKQDTIAGTNHVINENDRIENYDEIDSIRLGKALIRALAIGNQNINSGSFTKEFKSIPDSTVEVTTKLVMKKFFTNEYKHLIIYRQSPATICIDIYLNKNRTFRNVLAHKQWNLEYVKDTIQDVNGDGHPDFLVNWYGSTGCCLKNFYNVYLFQPATGTFSKGYEFINPTFSAKEGVIRGVCYGHPGETEMYKYKWNGLKVDTIEYIYPDKNKKGHYIKANKRSVYSKGLLETNLKMIPKEYKNIYGYDWFVGEGY